MSLSAQGRGGGSRATRPQPRRTAEYRTRNRRTMKGKKVHPSEACVDGSKCPVSESDTSPQTQLDQRRGTRTLLRSTGSSSLFDLGIAEKAGVWTTSGMTGTFLNRMNPPPQRVSPRCAGFAEPVLAIYPRAYATKLQTYRRAARTCPQENPLQTTFTLQTSLFKLPLRPPSEPKGSKSKKTES